MPQSICPASLDCCPARARHLWLPSLLFLAGIACAQVPGESGALPPPPPMVDERPEARRVTPLEVQDEPLADVVARLQTETGTPIRISDPALGSKTVILYQTQSISLGNTLRALAMQVGGKLVIDRDATGETSLLRIVPQPNPPAGTAVAKVRPVAAARAYAKPPRDINMESKYRTLAGLCFRRKMDEAEAQAKEVLELGYRGTRYECWVHDKLAVAYDALGDRSSAVTCYRKVIKCSDPAKGAYQRAAKRLREWGEKLSETGQSEQPTQPTEPTPSAGPR